MRAWFHARGRKLLSLLSDLGGALSFVVLAVGFIAAAVAGTVLFAIEVFPQPFLSILVLGIALLAAGLALHFLRSYLAPSPVEIAPSLSAPLQEAAATSWTGSDNAYSRAAAMQRQHDDVEALKALRRVREELRDNRRHVQRASEGNIGQIRQISLQAWGECEEILLGLPSSTPHSFARHAYRELEGIQDVLYIRESRTTLSLRRQPKDLLETDVHTTLEAIDGAIERLSEAEAV